MNSKTVIPKNLNLAIYIMQEARTCIRWKHIFDDGVLRGLFTRIRIHQPYIYLINFQSLSFETTLVTMKTFA